LIYRVEVGFKPNIPDGPGMRVQKRVAQETGVSLDSVRVLSIYLINADIDHDTLERLTRDAFYDPVVQDLTLDAPFRNDADWWIEVGFKPGVTDNVAKTARQVISDYLGRPLKAGEGVYCATATLLYGNASEEEACLIAHRILGNPLIHRFILFPKTALTENFEALRTLPVVKLDVKQEARRFDLNLAETALVNLSRQRVLALSLTEMETLRDHMNRPEIIEQRGRWGLDHRVTDVELEAIAQTWSEHCKHKIFNATIDYTDEHGHTHTLHSLFNTYIRATTEQLRPTRPWLLSVFHDNAGVIRFNDEFNVVYKVETHNSPSALDPYGGAMTGIVGVNRDPFGKGRSAELMINVWGYCFGSPFFTGELPEGLLHPR